MRNVINAIANVTTIVNAVRTDRAVAAGMDTVRSFAPHYPRLHASPALALASTGKQLKQRKQGQGCGQRGSCLSESWLSGSGRLWSGSIRVIS